MKKLINTVLTTLALAAVLPMAALAETTSVPHSLLDAREKLLHERDNLLADRADLNTKLNSLLSARMQIDKALGQTPQSRQALEFTRSRIVMQIAKTQTFLDQTERDIINNDKDLNEVESEVKHFACLNLPM